MIGSIFGVISNIHENKITVQCGNFGFELLCPQAQNLSIKQEIFLYTYLHWSAEQGPNLFGFLQQLQKDVFLLIISCSGIGPKLGLSILQQIDPVDFLHLVAQSDTAKLSSLKGLGSKKAEQLCTTLREKAGKLIQSLPHTTQTTSLGIWSDLQATLTSLNYSTQEIKQTTSELKQTLSNQAPPPFEILLRKALTILSK